MLTPKDQAPGGGGGGDEARYRPREERRQQEFLPQDLSDLGSFTHWFSM